MPSGLYSDPFLKSLIEGEPELAQEFFEALVKSDWLDNSVIYCLEVPGWVLEKIGPSAAINPNHPLHQKDDLSKDREGTPPFEGDPESVFWEKYWGESQSHHHSISSIPYLQLFKVNFFADPGNKKFTSLSNLNPNIEKYFTKLGHPLSLLLQSDISGDFELTLDTLLEITSYQLMQRLLWTDLCERKDFKIYRRNAYRTDDLFISHPILGRDFEEAEPENATWLGGVFIFDDQNWLLGKEELNEYSAADELGAYHESLEVMLEDENYEVIGQKLVALALTVPEIKDQYGFELSEHAENWIIQTALTDYVSPESFDVSAELNPNFSDMLSWRKIPTSKKEKIFELLKLGFNEDESKLRNDCKHFLGCIALHEDTPNEIFQKLFELNDALINEILASNPNLPGELKSKVSEYNDLQFNKKLALDQNASIETLVRLSRHESALVRRLVAFHPKTPLKIVVKLISDPHSDVRGYLASRTDISNEMLHTLSRDTSDFVRGNVAMNPITPIELLPEFSRSIDMFVRFGVANNPNTPLEILKVLSHDQDENVRKAVNENRVWSAHGEGSKS